MNNAFLYLACAAAALLMLGVTPYFVSYRSYFRYAGVFFSGILVGSAYASFMTPSSVYQLHFGLSPIVLLGAAILAAIVLVLVLWIAAR